GASGSLQSACFPGARRAESASCLGCRRRAPTARHVGVAPFIVNNNPETSERSRRSFPTATGWLFARPAVAHECWIAALSVPRAQRSTASGTRDSVGRVRSLIHFSNSPSRSRGAFLRPGFATLLHSPRVEGCAERRETFGCSGTRGACT